MERIRVPSYALVTTMGDRGSSPLAIVRRLELVMRVLITVPSLDQSFGGPALKAPNLAKELRRQGYSVRLAGIGTSADRGTIALDRLFNFHKTPVPRSVAPLSAAVNAADIVHIIGFRDPVGTTAALQARLARTPYVLEPVGMHRRRIRSRFIKSVFDRTVGGLVIGGASLLVATSALERSELARDGVPAGKVMIRPNGLDLPGKVGERGRIRQAMGIADDAPFVLTLGRITKKKGLLHVAELALVDERLRILIAGPPDGDGTLGELRGFVRSHGLDARVRLEPRGLWGQDKAQAFVDADVFVLPSETENFGIAAAEAAAAGLPVVVSDRCGVAEVLPRASAEVVPFGDLGALLTAVRTLLGRRREASMAAESVRRNLGWSRIAAEQARIYDLATAL